MQAVWAIRWLAGLRSVHRGRHRSAPSRLRLASAISSPACLHIPHCPLCNTLDNTDIRCLHTNMHTLRRDQKASQGQGIDGRLDFIKTASFSQQKEH